MIMAIMVFIITVPITITIVIIDIVLIHTVILITMPIEHPWLRERLAVHRLRRRRRGGRSRAFDHGKVAAAAPKMGAPA